MAQMSRKQTVRARRTPRARTRRARVKVPKLSVEQTKELRSELYTYATETLGIESKGAAYLADVFTKPVHV